MRRRIKGDLTDCEYVVVVQALLAVKSTKEIELVSCRSNENVLLTS